ncbi:MAG TPA: hypothetical protein VLF63_03445 [Patescibacteria group bacterium]|nr:hypothetical protein [Patescibacteria group bacterium]
MPKSKSSSVAELQGSFFDHINGSELINESIPERPLPETVVKGPQGSYVDLDRRAAFIGGALTAFGKRNQRIGFDLASNYTPYRDSIEDKYKEKLPFVQSGASANVKSFAQQAQSDFEKGGGYEELKQTYLFPTREIEAIKRDDWRRFTTKYSSPENRRQRDRYQRTLKRTQRLAAKIIKNAVKSK